MCYRPFFYPMSNDMILRRKHHVWCTLHTPLSPSSSKTDPVGSFRVLLLVVYLHFPLCETRSNCHIRVCVGRNISLGLLSDCQSPICGHVHLVNQCQFQFDTRVTSLGPGLRTIYKTYSGDNRLVIKEKRRNSERERRETRGQERKMEGKEKSKEKKKKDLTTVLYLSCLNFKMSIWKDPNKD